MKKLSFILFSFCCLTSQAQNDRLKDRNSIAWPQVHVTLPMGKKLDLLVEYQWRRTDGLKNWQQSLLRGAVQYKLHPQVNIAIGYGWIETFPYGDFPIAANGTFPEHRIYEQVVYKSNLRKLSVSQRLRVEQRWLGRRLSSAEPREIEEWLFSHRFRYLLRLQHPLTSSGKWYGAVADELFIGAGRNVGVNTFDQNRLMLLFGAKLNTALTLEAGYLSQTVMQGRRVNGNTIIQDNEGVTLALLVTL